MSIEKPVGTPRSKGQQAQPKQVASAKRGPFPGMQPKPQRQTSAAGAGVLVFLVMLFFIVGSGAAVFFDWGGSKDKLAEILGIYSRIETREAQAKAKEDETQKLQKSLEATSAVQQKEKANLEKRAAEAAKNKAAIDEERNQLEEHKLTDQERQAELEKLAQALGQMDSVKAGNIISKLSGTDQMVFLMKQMPAESAAQVLANMEPDLAAKILQAIIQG